MADYKELLRRAIKALPENNGAARRGVYEKARSALVGQLRAINPPLPAKDITQHRLQLEDCIRQVEQEASEAVITLKRQHHHDEPAASRPYAAPQAVPPVSKPETSASAQPATAAEALADGKPDPVKAEPVKSEPVAAEPAPQAVATDPGSAGKPEAGSIEDIIAQAEAAGGKLLREGKPETAKAADKPDDKPATKTPQPEPRPGPRPVPSIVARAEAAKAGPTSPIGLVGGSGPRLFDSGRRAPGFDPRRDAAHAAAAHHVPVAAPRLEPSIRAQSSARQQVAEPLSFVDQAAVAPAMSAVREVDVERDLAAAPTADAENAIERAIATLDREARGDTPPVNGTRIEFPGASPANGAAAALRDEPDETSSRGPIAAETGFGRGAMERERGGGSAVTIFLLVFVVLLAGAGGGGYWAYREGYINIDQMFGRTTQSVVGGTVIPETGADAATAELANPATEAIELVTGPGNTAPLAEAIDPAIELGTDERLTPETAVAAAADPALSGDPAAPATMADPATEALALAATAPAGEAVEAEERLPSSDVALGDAQLPEGTAGSAFPEAIAGSQSLLLEAADDGTTGAVPFSGTVDWSKGIDELGQPTLVGTANIPARNLTVDLMIRKNADPSLPASHVMEIDFTVNATFIGGSVAQLPGVLLKDAELVQGTPLVGASARVVGNSFLFALSASAQDNATNIALMTSRKWIDLALVYATGKRAIITLEKDEAAEALFAEVFAAWSATTDSASTVQ